MQEGCGAGSSGAAVAGPEAVVGGHLPPPPSILGPLHPPPAPSGFQLRRGLRASQPSVIQGQPHIILSKERNQSRRESEAAAAIPVKDERLIVI